MRHGSDKALRDAACLKSFTLKMSKLISGKPSVLPLFRSLYLGETVKSTEANTLIPVISPNPLEAKSKEMVRD